MADERWDDEEQLVVFRLGAESYGVRIAVVREIITLQPVTRVPHPEYLEGVINLRGRVIPVIDLRRRLGLESGERDRLTRIVVVEGEGGVVGMVVDAVSEVLTISGERIEPPAPYAGIDDRYVRGIAKAGERLIILLDLDRVATNVCVESTVRDAFFRDYYNVICADWCATFDEESHRAALRVLDWGFGEVVGSADVCRLWQRAAARAV